MSYLGFLSTSSQLCHSLVSVMQRAFDRLLLCPTTSTQVRWLPIFPYIPCKASCESTKARRLISYVWGAKGGGLVLKHSCAIIMPFYPFDSVRVLYLTVNAVKKFLRSNNLLESHVFYFRHSFLE